MERKTSPTSKTLTLYVIFNALLLITGLCTMATGIYLCVIASEYSWYDTSFSGLGLVMAITSIIGYRARFLSEAISCYLSAILVLLVIQSSFTLGILLYSGFAGEIGKQNSMILAYALICSCLVIIGCLTIGLIYRKNLLKTEPIVHTISLHSPILTANKNDIKGYQTYGGTKYF
ncbi:unnamed protein product [Blepharisma stoltei]|uniref:NADH dehydrogenase subunit 6 n=1 Tax=Blepharisma stoltei TaxID=1481888 RepID=A0AAU9IHE8_9CILI|nr:unnamed protein product [Blepharisma stoltei]